MPRRVDGISRSGLDEYEGGLPERLDPALLRELSQLSPIRSGAHIAAEWGAIVAAAAAAWLVWNPVVTVLAVCFIAGRQHALLVLMHEGTHYRLFRSRAVNDWVTEVFCAWPFLLFTMHEYRRNHFPHHRHTNTGDDPDFVRKQTAEWRFPQRPARLAGQLLADVTGVGFARLLLTIGRLRREIGASPVQRSRAFEIGRWVFLGTLAAALAITGGWIPFLLFWVLPFVTWMQLGYHVRAIAEHFAIESRPGVYGKTRTVLSTWLERVFLVPKNVNYHLEHHLFPSVPFFRLPKLHRILMERPRYRENAAVTRGYWRVLAECTGSRGSAER